MVSQRSSAIVQTDQQFDSFSLEPLGESSVLAGAVTDDPVLAGVFNSLAGISLFAGSIAIGGGVLPAMLIAAGTVITLINDFVYVAGGNRAYDQATKAKRSPRPVVVDEPEVTVPDQPLAPSLVELAAKEAQPVVTAETPSVDLLNLPKLIVDEIYSYAVIAPSGGGKGMLMSNVVREFKRRYPDRPIIFIDPKDDPKEAGYWEGVVDIWHRANFRRMEIEDKSAFLNEALDIIRSVNEPHLAIMDECTMTFGFANKCDTKLANRLQDFTTSVASGGNSAEEYVFLLGHSPNLGDYGISGGQMSSFRKVYIAPTSNQESIIQLCGTTFAGGKQSDSKAKEILTIAQQSPVDRAVYVGTKNAWYSMGTLENHSGYNRDTRTQIGTSTTVAPTATTPAVDPKFETLIANLADVMRQAVAKNYDVNALTPEKLVKHQLGVAAGLTYENATIALERAKQAVGVL